jgi:ribosomal protein S18 acetylase RimI-like enzyme
MGTDELANPQSALRGPHPAIEALTVQTVRDLRLPWLSKFNHENLAMYVSENPGKSLRVAGTNEYLVGERWRGRDDIANIVEVAARHNKRALVEEWIARVSSGGELAMALVAQEVWRDDVRLFEQLGFGLVEKIVFFERNLPSRFDWWAYAAEQEFPLLEIDRVTVADIEPLLEVDHNSFPWLWWNSRDEMGTYMSMPEVSVYRAKLRDEPVGYASFTMYNGWAHLDRLAVVHEAQGRGYGATQLAFALAQMVKRGARSVALSTQENNTQSHRLYKRFGFQLGRDPMAIYGRALREPNN